MAQTIPFAPSNSAQIPFSTIITLDGISYILLAFWNMYSQRWYITLQDQNGTVVLHTPLVGCLSSGNPIDLTYGLFTASTLVYQSDTGNLVATP